MTRLPDDPLGLSARQRLQSEFSEYIETLVRHAQLNQEFVANLPDGTLVQLPDGSRVPVETLR